MRVRKTSICLGLRIFTWIGCLGWFLNNSFETLRDYIEGETFETTLEKTLDGKEVFLPDVVICSKSRFINNFKETRTIEEYKNNTIDASHFIQRLELMFGKNESMNVISKDLFTLSFGWCKNLQIEVDICGT